MVRVTLPSGVTVEAETMEVAVDITGALRIIPGGPPLRVVEAAENASSSGAGDGAGSVKANEAQASVHPRTMTEAMAMWREQRAANTPVYRVAGDALEEVARLRRGLERLADATPMNDASQDLEVYDRREYAQRILDGGEP